MSDNALIKLTHIIQSAAHANSIEGQVQHIVDAISESLSVDVCSLYQQVADGSLLLVASHGLLQIHPVVIPAGRGLVGQVIKLQHSINIKDPHQHPGYYYVPDSQEEQFNSFCGVPLVYRGAVNGVLVVQSRRAEVLPTDQEALLLTLATHLALLLASVPPPSTAKAITENRHKGIAGAPGIAIGHASIRLSAQLAEVQKKHAENSVAELVAWNNLKADVLKELHREREVVNNAMGEGLAAVIDAYQMLLLDPTFDKHIANQIAEGWSLPWALKQTVSFFSDQFKGMDDPYLNARHEDIEHLGDKLYLEWQGSASAPIAELKPSAEPLVLVGQHISVSDIVSLPTEQLVGIVCYGGASLSHIAVFANALGIPAVMGLGSLPIQEGQLLIVDGEAAEVFVAPTKTLLAEYRKALKERQALTDRQQADSQLPAITLDGTRVTLLANSGLQADVMPGLRNGAEGIGLYRTEIPFMVRPNLPSEAEQVEVYRYLIDQYDDKPVYIRTLDIGADKPLPYLPKVEEENPALGWRGIRFTLDNVPLLMTQIRAVIQAAGGRDNVHLLLPMIASTEQLDQSIAILDEALVQLLEEGHAVCRPKVGIMVEVPSSISLLQFWRDKLDFISIGTNDLSQYLLALDRNSPLVGKWYDALHPAVLHELDRIVRIAKEVNLPLSVCGEMSSDPVAVLLMIGMGVRRLSMSAAKIPLIKWMIRAIDKAEAEALLAEALREQTASAIRELGLAFLQAKNIQH